MSKNFNYSEFLGYWFIKDVMQFKSEFITPFDIQCNNPYQNPLYENNNFVSYASVVKTVQT